jgi:AcrR family transcriptional regulator
VVNANEPRTRGRPRRTETDEQIVRATQELIREHGPESVNVAAVSGRSGVARTTIYRRYQDRQALLTAALQSVADRGAPPDGLSIHDKVTWVLARTEDVLGQGIGPGGVASVIANTDPEFSSALRLSLEKGLEPLLEQIASDVAAGELVAYADPDLLLNLMIGSYLAESLRRGTPGMQWRKQTATLLGRLLATSDEKPR